MELFCLLLLDLSVFECFACRLLQVIHRDGAECRKVSVGAVRRDGCNFRRSLTLEVITEALAVFVPFFTQLGRLPHPVFIALLQLGTDREAVSRSLKKMNKDGSIQISRGSIRILDKRRLYEMMNTF